MDKLHFERISDGRYRVVAPWGILGIVTRYGKGGTPWWKPSGWKVRCNTRAEAAQMLLSLETFAARIG